MNFKTFVAHNKISIKNEYADRNPNMADSERSMDNWKVTLKMGKRQLTTYFSKGFGHNGKEPDACEVLEALQMDISSVMNYDLGEFIREYSYSCKEGKRIYKACEKSETRMKKFLGDKFEKFMELDDYNEDDEEDTEDAE